MTETLSAYDVALASLEYAMKIQDYPSNAEEVLNDAEKIHAWLVEKSEFQPVPADVDRYVYFADEARNVQGEFPSYTYWHRYDKLTGEIRRVEDDGHIVFPASLRDETLAELRAKTWLTEVPVTEVPEEAR